MIPSFLGSSTDPAIASGHAGDLDVKAILSLRLGDIHSRIGFRKHGLQTLGESGERNRSYAARNRTPLACRGLRQQGPDPLQCHRCLSGI